MNVNNNYSLDPIAASHADDAEHVRGGFVLMPPGAVMRLAAPPEALLSNQAVYPFHLERDGYTAVWMCWPHIVRVVAPDGEVSYWQFSAFHEDVELTKLRARYAFWIAVEQLHAGLLT